MKCRAEFRQVHNKLRTTKVIYKDLIRIYFSLRYGDSPPSIMTHFESDLDERLQMALRDHRKIG